MNLNKEDIDLKEGSLMVPMHQETHNSESDSLIQSSLVVQGQNENFEKRNVELKLQMSPKPQVCIFSFEES